MLGVGNRHSLRLSGAAPKTQPWQESNGIQGARTMPNHGPGLSISLLEMRLPPMCPVVAAGARQGQHIHLLSTGWGKPQGQTSLWSYYPTRGAAPLACPSPGQEVWHHKLPIPPLHPSESGILHPGQGPTGRGAVRAGRGGQGGLCMMTAERACPAAPPAHPGTTHMAPAPRMLLTSAPLQLAQRLLAFIDCQ